jgi:heat shock protein HslJ
MLPILLPDRIKGITLSTLLGYLLCVAILLSACAPGLPVPAATSTPVVIDLNQLYANPWALVAFGDPANPTVVQQGTNLTAVFAADGTLSGFGGCNNFSGTYQAETNGTMTIGPLASTAMACADSMDAPTDTSAMQNPRRDIALQLPTQMGGGIVLALSSSVQP